MLVAAYLLRLHIKIAGNPRRGLCTFTDTLSCDKVLASPYAEILGTPVALIGLLGFSLLLGLAAWRLLCPDRSPRRLPAILALMAGVGLLFELGMTGVEVAVIQALCPYCLTALGLITVAFVAAVIGWRVQRRARGLEAGRVRAAAGPRCLAVLVLFGGLASILAGVCVVPGYGSGQARAAELSRPAAPAFALPDLDGRRRSLEEFLGGKPILLEFMSLDCPHCREMAPILARLYRVYEERIQFLAVAFDRNPRRVRTFVERENHAWPYLMGSQETIDAYRLEGVPTFFLVTPDGRIGGFQVGSASYEAISQGIEAVLRGP
jgi:uncharacterized membrane protein/thiol-disulfide isomerase/thioredoxin